MGKVNSFVQEGSFLDFANTSGADIGYRDVVVSGGRMFVAQENIKNGATGSVSAHGVYEMPADNTAAFTFGETLYWDNTSGKLTKTSSGNTKAGFAAAAKATAEAVALVKIDY